MPPLAKRFRIWLFRRLEPSVEMPQGVSSNGANSPELQTRLNVAPSGQPGIGGEVELKNVGVSVQK